MRQRSKSMSNVAEFQKKLDVYNKNNAGKELFEQHTIKPSDMMKISVSSNVEAEDIQDATTVLNSEIDNLNKALSSLQDANNNLKTILADVFTTIGKWHDSAIADLNREHDSAITNLNREYSTATSTLNNLQNITNNVQSTAIPNLQVDISKWYNSRVKELHEKYTDTAGDAIRLADKPEAKVEPMPVVDNSATTVSIPYTAVPAAEEASNTPLIDTTTAHKPAEIPTIEITPAA